MAWDVFSVSEQCQVFAEVGRARVFLEACGAAVYMRA